MECNVGGTEKNVRLIGGAATIALGLFAPMNRTAKIAAMAIGLMEITTALTGYCPINQLIGRNTCRLDLENLPHEAEKALQNAKEFAA